MGSVRTGWSLAIVAIVAAVCFVLTDAWFGLGFGWDSANVIDRAVQSRFGTLTGLIGCGFTLLVGLFLGTRRDR